jgi:hypothetical protein
VSVRTSSVVATGMIALVAIGLVTIFGGTIAAVVSPPESAIPASSAVPAPNAASAPATASHQVTSKPNAQPNPDKR